MSLTTSILEIVEESARSHDATHVTKVTLSVGELSDVVADSMSFAFEALSPGTICEGAELVIDTVCAVARCQLCATEFHPDPLDFTCPKCGNPLTQVIHGKELTIASIEIDDGLPPSGGEQAAPPPPAKEARPDG